jgi:hypothetical protein
LSSSCPIFVLPKNTFLLEKHSGEKDGFKGHI